MVVSGGGTPPPAVVVAKVEKLAMVAEVVGRSLPPTSRGRAACLGTLTVL